MKKKLFALALCVIMVVAMAVPALAATPNVATTFTFGNRRIAAQGVYGGALVSLDTIDYTAYERWYLQRDIAGNWRLYSALDHTVGGGYTMNRSSNGSVCILWPDNIDDITLNDSVIDLLTVSSGVQRISLERSITSNKYLNNISGNSLVWTTSGAAFNVAP